MRGRLCSRERLGYVEGVTYGSKLIRRSVIPLQLDYHAPQSATAAARRRPRVSVGIATWLIASDVLVAAVVLLVGSVVSDHGAGVKLCAGALGAGFLVLACAIGRDALACFRAG